MKTVVFFMVVLVVCASSMQAAWAKDCKCSYMAVYVPGHSFDIAFETNFGTLRDGIWQSGGTHIIATCTCIEGQTRSSCRVLEEHAPGVGGTEYLDDPELMCVWNEGSCINSGCYDE